MKTKKEIREEYIKSIRADIDENDSYPPEPAKLKKWAPRVFEAYFGKRYILPNYRTPDYFRQEFLNYCEWAAICMYPYADPKDEILRAQFAASVIALKHKRPQLFLERELGEALIRTALPLDMVAEDIKWRWPAMRIYLPKNLITINRENYEHSLMYLDIALLDESKWETVPREFAPEFDLFNLKEGPDLEPRFVFTDFRFAYPDRAFIMTGIIEKGPTNAGLTTYAMVKPFSHYTLKYLREMTDSLRSEWECDPVDDAFLRKTETVAINILLFLSAYPLEYPPEKALRKPRLQGKEHLAGLYPAKFVGQSQIRPEYKQHAVAHMVTQEEWHQRLHWRCGHWHRYHYGPKRGQTKLLWISPYQAGREEEEKQKETK